MHRTSAWVDAESIRHGCAGAQATPAMRLQAIGLTGILRTVTSPEIRTAIAGLSPEDSIAYVRDWLHTTGQAT